MTVKDEARKEIEELLASGSNLFEKLSSDNRFEFHFEYQQWYSRALKALELLARDRYVEFRSYYEIDPKRRSLGYGTYVVQDYLKGVVPSSTRYPGFNAKGQVIQCLFNQTAILKGVLSRLDSVISDIVDELYVELKDAEIDVAKELLKVNVRASGALAGVVLEGYLGKICAAHQITFRKKHPTISDFNDALKNSGVYKTPTWRKISYLGDVRNTCCHKKGQDPSREEVQELVEGTVWVTKNVF